MESQCYRVIGTHCGIECLLEVWSGRYCVIVLSCYRYAPQRRVPSLPVLSCYRVIVLSGKHRGVKCRRCQCYRVIMLWCYRVHTAASSAVVIVLSCYRVIATHRSVECRRCQCYRVIGLLCYRVSTVASSAVVASVIVLSCYGVIGYTPRHRVPSLLCYRVIVLSGTHRGVECLLEVGDQVLDVLDADRQPDEVLQDAEFVTLLLRHRRVRHDRAETGPKYVTAEHPRHSTLDARDVAE